MLDATKNIYNIEHYKSSTYKKSTKEILNAGTSENNTKIIELNKSYINPKFYPRKFQEWPDTFSVTLLSDNRLQITRTDIKHGGWGSPLLIDVEEEIISTNYSKLEEKKIPRVIYQTFKSKTLTKGMYEAIQSWININPEYEYYFYDDNDCVEFIKNNFDDSVLNAYLRLIPGAFKADLWRCCVLYQHGGVYIDADMICLKPLDQYILKNDEFVVARDDPMSKSYLYNAFIACTPKHDFMKKQIESIVQNVETQSKLYHLDISGPGLLGKSVNKCLGNDLNAEFKLGNLLHNKYNIKILSHEWKSKTVNLLKDELILTEYPDKNTEMKKANIPTYYSLYQKDMIYQQIPRKIYFTGHDHLSINKYMVDSFQNKNHNWEMIFFTEEDKINFFKQNNIKLIEALNIDVYQKFLNIKNGGARADLWRYCVIFLYGGVYTDSDTLCIKPLDEWILHHDLILGIEACIPKSEDCFGLKTVGKLVNNNIISVCNWTFAAVAGHEFLKNVIINICSKETDDINSKPATISTGPKIFTDEAFKYFDGCNFTDLEKQLDIIKKSSILFSINKFGSNQGHSKSCSFNNISNNNEINIVHFFDGAWRSIPNKSIKKYKSKLGVSHNLTLSKQNNSYFGISRLDKDTSRTIFLKTIGDCRSLLSIAFDNNFNILKEKEIYITGFQDEAKFEDYRLFTFNHNQYCSVSYIDKNFNTRVAILDNNFYFLGNVNLKNKNLNRAWDRIWEKNWLFFEKDNELYFIYSTTPRLIIFKCIDFTNLIFDIVIDRKWELDAPKDNLYFGDTITTGGSTNPVYLEDKQLYLYIIHTKAYQKKKYNHYFIVLDKDLNPVKFCDRPVISEFIPDSLCFVSSMLIEQDYIVLSGGIDDNKNFIWELSKEFIFKKIIGIN